MHVKSVCNYRALNFILICLVLLNLLVYLPLVGTVHDPYFPMEKLFPSAISYAKIMFHRNEIALTAKKKSKELYSVMSSVNDIYRVSSSYFFLFFPIFWPVSYFLLFFHEIPSFSYFLRV